MRNGENVSLTGERVDRIGADWDELKQVSFAGSGLRGDAYGDMVLDDGETSRSELAGVKINAPKWLHTDLGGDYSEIDWDLLGETQGDVEKPVLADFNSELAKRYVRLREESGLDFFQLSVATIEDEFNRQDLPENEGDDLPLRYADMSDKSLVEVAAIMNAMGGSFRGLPEDCRTESEIDKYYNEFRGLCEALQGRELTYAGDMEKIEMLRDGATIFLQEVANNYRADVNYDMQKIIGTVELLGSPKNNSLGMYYTYNFRDISVAQIGCEALVAGRDPSEVEAYLEARQQIGQEYDAVWYADNKDITLTNISVEVMGAKMCDMDDGFREGEWSEQKTVATARDCGRIRELVTEKDGEPLSRNYGILLEHFNPVIAERCRKIADEQQTDMSDMELALTQYSVIKNWDKNRFDKFSDERLRQLAEVVSALELRDLQYWTNEKDVEKLYGNMAALKTQLADIDGMGQKTLGCLVKHLTSVDSKRISEDVATAKRLMEAAKSHAQIELTDDYCKGFVENAFRESTLYNYSIDEIMDYHQVGREICDEYSELALKVLQDAFKGKTLKPEDLRVYQVETAPVIGEMAEEVSDDELEVARVFLSRYGVGRDTALGLKERVLPLLREGSTEVESLSRWRKGELLRGENRLMDFEARALTTRINPRNLNSLMLDCRILPTSDLRKLEQNRIDALAIEGVVLPDHGFIHDEAPLTNRLLTAMVEYYDKRDSDEAKQAEAALQKIVAECQTSTNTLGTGRYGRLAPDVFELERYDQKIEGQVNDDAHVREYNETAIEVLRRLVQGTKQDDLEIPGTGDEVLKNLMERAAAWQDLESGEMRTDWREVSLLVAYMNKQLLDRQDEIGIEPSIVKVLTYTERMATFAMRGVTLRDWRELLYDAGFKEMVKFRELTGSVEQFNEERFEDFWNGIRNIGAEPDDEEIREQYQKLQNRILGQVNQLAMEYNANGQSQYVGALWSGNLTHELMNLTDRPQPRTLRERSQTAF